MNINLVFKLSKEKISISSYKKDVDYKSLNNTNVINTEELKFSNEYIVENKDLVTSFLNVVILKNEITKIQINNMEIASLCMDLINEWDNIKSIKFKPDEAIPHEVFFKLLDNKYVEELEVYELPEYMIERVDLNKNIKVITRHEIEYTSEFVKDNAIKSYSDIYYKKMFVINHELNNTEIEDIKTILRINTRVRLIRILHYSNEIILTLLEILKELNKKNVKIAINEKGNELEIIYNSIEYVKKEYKKFINENKIEIKLQYSKEYKSKNLFKELNIVTLEYIIIFVLIVGFAIVLSNYYHQYRDQQKVDSQLSDIDEIMNDAEQEVTIEATEEDYTLIDISDGDEEVTTKKSSYKSAYYTNFTKAFDKLLKKNPDTVGWLTVNNTKINYPVVQSKDNKYYLGRDFNKKKNSMGWVFVDYRDDMENLSDNTIIYAHNIKTGIMFGSLKRVLTKSWYKNKTNQIITFNTPSKNMKWQVFSVYKIKKTTDYLVSDFTSEKEKTKWIAMVKKRSLYDFKVDVTADSKILTLSTCNNHVNRTVLHAVLIEDETEQ